MIQYTFYVGVDILSTLIEIFMLYAVSHALGADREKGIVKYIPYCLSTIMVFVCTWLIPILCKTSGKTGNYPADRRADSH